MRGVLQVDGHAGFKPLERSRNDGSVVLAFCWAHLRRRFFEIHAGTASKGPSTPPRSATCANVASRATRSSGASMSVVRSGATTGFGTRMTSPAACSARSRSR
ncbi:MAG: IS66 family transposase [Roseomonas sp.]|nr:IS66 family transposase [Roseomonas sp.]